MCSGWNVPASASMTMLQVTVSASLAQQKLFIFLEIYTFPKLFQAFLPEMECIIKLNGGTKALH